MKREVKEIPTVVTRVTYICEKCAVSYQTEEAALACERFHRQSNCKHLNTTFFFIEDYKGTPIDEICEYCPACGNTLKVYPIECNPKFEQEFIRELIKLIERYK